MAQNTGNPQVDAASLSAFNSATRRDNGDTAHPFRATDSLFNDVGSNPHIEVVPPGFSATSSREEIHELAELRRCEPFDRAESPKNTSSNRTIPDAPPVASVGALGAASGPEVLPPGNVPQPECCGKATTATRRGQQAWGEQKVQSVSWPEFGFNKIDVGTSVAPGVLPLEAAPVSPVVVVQPADSPSLQEQPLAKTRKTAARKPSLRAPTPSRVRGGFSRNGHAAGGKNGSVRPVPGAETDRVRNDYDADSPFDDEFEELDRETDDTADEVAAEESHGDGGSDCQIDDPIRMYLMQMGEIPLLNRAAGNRLGQAH